MISNWNGKFDINGVKYDDTLHYQGHLNLFLFHTKRFTLLPSKSSFFSKSTVVLNSHNLTLNPVDLILERT